MKLWSREALTLGGIYSVLSTPFLMLKTPMAEQIALSLFAMFIICMFLLYSPKFSLWVGKQTDNFPKLSYYLMSIGWLPYFLIIGPLAIFICAGVFAWDDDILNSTMSVFNLICSWGLPVSLIVAYIRIKTKIRL